MARDGKRVRKDLGAFCVMVIPIHSNPFRATPPTRSLLNPTLPPHAHSPPSAPSPHRTPHLHTYSSSSAGDPCCCSPLHHLLRSRHHHPHPPLSSFHGD